MKLKFLTLAIFAFIQFNSFSQIVINLDSCGINAFDSIGMDVTGRIIYQDQGMNFNVQWNDTLNWWEIIQLPGTIWYTNSFASSPNPPCENIGSWININSTCGSVDSIFGSCQTFLVGLQNQEKKKVICDFSKSF